jgi:hypothetical protein
MKKNGDRPGGTAKALNAVLLAADPQASLPPAPAWATLVTMGKQPRSQPGPPMTLGNMRSLGVRSLAVSCELCHHAAVLSAEPWPDHVPVPTFRLRMLCSRCGIIGADARPNWREQAERPSLPDRSRVLSRRRLD